MIYQEISQYGFENAFYSSAYKDNFSPEALNELFNYYDSIGENIELDIVAVCCEWTEQDEETTLKDYDIDNISELEDMTYVIKLDNGNILYQCF